MMVVAHFYCEEAIAGIFAMPTMPLTKASPSQPGTGDVIVAETSKWFDLYVWDPMKSATAQ